MGKKKKVAQEPKGHATLSPSGVKCTGTTPLPQEGWGPTLPRAHTGRPNFAPWSCSQKEACVCRHWIPRRKPKVVRPGPRANQTPSIALASTEEKRRPQGGIQPVAAGEGAPAGALGGRASPSLFVSSPGNFGQVASLLQACETRRTAPPGSLCVMGSFEETNADVEGKVPYKVQNVMCTTPQSCRICRMHRACA